MRSVLVSVICLVFSLTEKPKLGTFQVCDGKNILPREAMVVVVNTSYRI